MKPLLHCVVLVMLCVLHQPVTALDINAGLDPMAYAVSAETGWPPYDVQLVLRERFIGFSNLTSVQAQNVLRDEMRLYSDDFMQCRVKFECIASIAAAETGHFEFMYQNNVGGITNSTGYLDFTTVEEGIQALDTLLWEEYILETGRYHAGITVQDVAQHYNTNFEWLVLYVDVRLSLQQRIEVELYGEAITGYREQPLPRI